MDEYVATVLKFIDGLSTIINFLDTLSTLIVGGFCIGVALLFRKFRKNRNILKGNRSGGSIAGGNIGPSNPFKEHIEQNNKLIKNVADKDIAGGDIEK